MTQWKMFLLKSLDEYNKQSAYFAFLWKKMAVDTFWCFGYKLGLDSVLSVSPDLKYYNLESQNSAPEQTHPNHLSLQFFSIEKSIKHWQSQREIS